MQLVSPRSSTLAIDMNLMELNDNFGIPGVLFFEEHNGLVRANISTAVATATVYLQGAHITAWQSTGQKPVLFLSSKSEFAAGKPIRGGVPISFPWFSNRHDGKAGPSHGFARIQDWTLAFAAISGEDLHLTFTLAPTQLSREFGFDHFRLAFQLTIGRSLTMQLTVANEAEAPLVFEEALHTYFAVGDVREVTVSGLEPTGFVDKTDNMTEKPAANAPLTFAGATDRVYPNTGATCVIHDKPNKRDITIAKTNSNTTVVFNPWKDLVDMGPDEWQKMLCVETVNAAVNAITLGSGESHTMEAHIAVASAGSSH
ncbi:MAG TPA: D-hexose-6-phosphate mutarotase [Edaphobacter sp.]|nr:D-hexose-6-phosphate mutarotase [Edaphobacter sp.]